MQQHDEAQPDPPGPPSGPASARAEAQAVGVVDAATGEHPAEEPAQTPDPAALRASADDTATTRTPSAQPRFFYGWVMLAIAMGLAFATLPAQTVLVSLWKEPMAQSLGLSITAVSLAYSVGTILAALPLPLVGRMADRFGLRITIGFVAVGFVLTLAMLLRHGVYGVVTLTIGFFFVRFLGQGALGMLSGHTVAMWFERKLGRAHALLAVGGFAAGSALMPQPTAWLITTVGGQTTLLILAGLVAVLTLPALIFFFRNRPEDIGQHLDGDPVEHETHDVAHGGAPPRDDPAYTVREAIRTPAYWIILVNMLATGFVGTALIFHMIPMLQQAGIEGTERQAALAIQPWPIAFGITTLFVGWLVDHYHPRFILPSALVLKAIAIGLCAWATAGAAVGLTSAGTIVFIMAAGMAVYGSSQAIIMGVGNPTIARYFGRTHHGAIRGTLATAIVMGTGGGPYAIALGYDLADADFIPVYIISLLLCFPLALWAIFLREPRR
ncbi:MAG: MFS transporter [Planctomycetota bacterium]